MDEVEAVARALCVEAGCDPDALEPGSDAYSDNTGIHDAVEDGEPYFKVWRLYVPNARAAIAALDARRRAQPDVVAEMFPPPPLSDFFGQIAGAPTPPFMPNDPTNVASDRAYRAGREAGLREAAALANDWYENGAAQKHGPPSYPNIARAILALIDAGSPTPPGSD